MLNKICLEHGIKPLAPEKARGTLEVEEYKEQRRQADELAEQNAQVKAELGEKMLINKADLLAYHNMEFFHYLILKSCRLHKLKIRIPLHMF